MSCMHKSVFSCLLYFGHEWFRQLCNRLSHQKLVFKCKMMRGGNVMLKSGVQEQSYVTVLFTSQKCAAITAKTWVCRAYGLHIRGYDRYLVAVSSFVCIRKIDDLAWSVSFHLRIWQSLDSSIKSSFEAECQTCRRYGLGTKQFERKH